MSEDKIGGGAAAVPVNWTSDDQRTYRTFKSALTRAVNRARKTPTVENHQLTVAVCLNFEKHYRDRGQAMPDDWARWQRAGDDARFALARLQPWR